MKWLSLICSVLLCGLLHAQCLTQSAGFSALDSSLLNVRLVGAGEATHGTSEFTTVRLELFQHLVQNHNFNTFFLEADVGACRRINRYIHGSGDQADSALFEVRLWPWLTEEMLALIKWCKSYNSLNNGIIQFVGCDMQLTQDDRKELLSLFESDLSNQNKIDSIFNDLGFHQSDSLRSIKKKQWESFKNFTTPVFSSTADSLKYEMLCVSIDQWFAIDPNSFTYTTLRDGFMADNIISYMKYFPEAKGMYFAHNGHVSNEMIERKRMKDFKTAGHYLKNEYGDAYVIIATTAYDLVFNAKTYVDEQVVMREFRVTEDDRKCLERFIINGHNEEIAVVPSKSVNKLHKYYIAGIGAGFDESYYKQWFFRRDRLESNTFDWFICLRETSATKLLVSFPH
ncbi:MAG: erythromycin esterase family protein [Fluviicola sp.]